MGQDSNHFSGRMLEIILLAADGMTDKQIAAELGISTNTVESHWKRLRTTYQTSSRVKIVASVLRELMASPGGTVGAEGRLERLFAAGPPAYRNPDACVAHPEDLNHTPGKGEAEFNRTKTIDLALACT